MKRNKTYFGLLILVLVAILSACDGGKKFEVKGEIANAGDSLLYLENVGIDNVTTVDSVKLGKDGSFDFKANATDAPEFYRLRIAGQIINLSIDSTETVSVKASYPTMSYDYKVEGSENCTKIRDLALLQRGLQMEVNNIIANPNLSMRSAADSVSVVVNAYKNNVLKNYIYKEPNKSYAYFALFQTVAVSGQPVLIFNPRNDPEDVKAFAAVATSWDTFHPGAKRCENLHNIALQEMKDTRLIAAQQQDKYVDASKVNTSGILDLSLPDNKGNMRRLSSLKGKVVLLDFCSFAQEGMNQRIMQMRELYNKYHAQGFEIYQVSFDGNQHFWKTQTAALPWVSVYDADGKSVGMYNIQNVPTFFLLDRNCNPYKRDAQIKDIDAEINSLLK